MNIQLSENDLKLILAALNELPYKVSAGTINHIHMQINNQKSEHENVDNLT